MNYQEVCDYLFRQTPSFEKTGKTGFNEGLANTLALDNHYGHPHQSFKTIHVAGTNGKGSVSHMLAAQLQADGYRVGLYTSPHLVDFRERIRINGEMIPEDYVVRFVEDFLQWQHPSPITQHPSPITLRPSFFELTTAMAFKYFKDEAIDIAVIEVGLGGRLDCTNIISPILSVITNISLDHTDMLGDSLAKIAGEKAGIIKYQTPVVIGENQIETRPVFEVKALLQHAPIVFAEDEPLVQKHDGSYVYVDVTRFDCDLKGDYQQKNINTVLHALQILQDLHIIKEVYFPAFAHVTETTGLMARWQKIQDAPLTICDTGHNVGGWQYLSQQISAVPCRQRRIVFGMVSDKDVSTVMEMLPKDAIYYYTQASTHRAIPVAEVQRMGDALGLRGTPYPTVTEAVRAAMSEAEPDDFVFIGGSTYLVADYLKTRI